MRTTAKYRNKKDIATTVLHRHLQTLNSILRHINFVYSILLCIPKYEHLTLNGALALIIAMSWRLINCRIIIIFRPPDKYCWRIYIFTTDSFFLSSSSSYFFRHLISELAERNSTKIGRMLGSNCDLKTHVQNLGYPLPLQIGGPIKNDFY